MLKIPFKSFLRNKRRLSLILFFCFAISFICISTKSKNKIHEWTPEILPLPRQVWIFYFGRWSNPLSSNQQYNNWGDPTRPNIQIFPQLGLYSSHDRSIIKEHLRQIADSGIDSIIYKFDSSNSYETETLDILLDEAQLFNIKIGLSFQNFNKSFVIPNHQSLLRIQNKPVLILGSPSSVTNYHDSLELSDHYYLISHVYEMIHVGMANEYGFQAVINTNVQSWASTPSEWRRIKKLAEDRGLIWAASVTPGEVHHWSDGRRNGVIYDNQWKTAIQNDARIVVINSFNNWADGTSIEPAIPKKGFEFTERNWMINGSSDSYLKRTKEFIDQFKSGL